ncbi:ricin-type beta-trefoil lectin domain protein [Stackebrandtia soli]|uniref:ricin-type beta-trefoil lectin domain protein n=1 Tax=Stackebrandtia soli TaxID=1892856 RepID=UPI0039E79D2B
MTHPRRRWTAGLGAIVIAAASLTLSATSPALAADRPEVTPLPANLETIRAAEATSLYGSPEIRPLDERATSIVTMGDSEISGEGVGNYDPNTHRDGNWCDRSYDQAAFRTGIDTDVQYNVACSGAASPHLIEGNGQTQWDELNQGDNLAIKARNTKIRMVWVVIGANDSGGIEFGPTMTQCVTNRVLFLGTCWEDETDSWAARVEVSRDGVEASIAAIRQTMTNAGYLDSDYQFTVMSYPSPISPDVEDNPDFPGWYAGGCLGYLEDAAFARNKAVPLFERGVRAAALDSGVRYLDASRLFDGHAVCDQNTWARGLYIEVGELPSEHAFRQSFHPNARGHGAFAACVTDFFNNPSWATATCVDPASTNGTTLYQGLLEFKDIKSNDSGLCVDANGYNSRNDTPLEAYGCHGGRNQGFWYDSAQQSLHIELSHDRCVDATSLTAGAPVLLWDCYGGANQNFLVDGSLIRTVSNPDLCLSMPTSSGGGLTLAACGGAGTSLSLSTRSYTNPVGYGYNDWIGSDTY